MTKPFVAVIFIIMIIYIIVESIVNIPSWLNNGVYLICTIFAVYFLIKMNVGKEFSKLFKEKFSTKPEEKNE